MKTLFLIPARGGSKRIPRKNLRLLKGKVLLHYSIEYARLFAKDCDICVSTDCEQVVTASLAAGLFVPFFRPKELSEDDSTTEAAIDHALRYYESMGVIYDRVVLLQPTSPYRKENHLTEALELWEPRLNVASVDPGGKLNGSIFIYDPVTIRPGYPSYYHKFYPMSYIYSVDINEEIDLHLAEHIYKEIKSQENVAPGYREFES